MRQDPKAALTSFVPGTQKMLAAATSLLLYLLISWVSRLPEQVIHANVIPLAGLDLVLVLLEWQLDWVLRAVS